VNLSKSGTNRYNSWSQQFRRALQRYWQRGELRHEYNRTSSRYTSVFTAIQCTNVESNASTSRKATPGAQHTGLSCTREMLLLSTPGEIHNSPTLLPVVGRHDRLGPRRLQQQQCYGAHNSCHFHSQASALSTGIQRLREQPGQSPV
jgi:hypothetical protein